MGTNINFKATIEYCINDKKIKSSFSIHNELLMDKSDIEKIELLIEFIKDGINLDYALMNDNNLYTKKVF